MGCFEGVAVRFLATAQKRGELGSKLCCSKAVCGCLDAGNDSREGGVEGIGFETGKQGKGRTRVGK